MSTRVGKINKTGAGYCFNYSIYKFYWITSFKRLVLEGWYVHIVYRQTPGLAQIKDFIDDITSHHYYGKIPLLRKAASQETTL
jgi:hypothetical protein